MSKAALLLAAAAMLACDRQRTYSPAPPIEPVEPRTARAGTWVATAGDLSPEQVRMLQRALGDRGFALELSGRYDAQTRTAVSDFQRSRSLPATGNLNAETASVLGLDPADVMPVRGESPPEIELPATSNGG